MTLNDGYNLRNILYKFLHIDRYVILGNHRDAWVFGAVDPSSGTATMLELSRSLGKLVKEGKICTGWSASGCHFYERLVIVYI